jgi:hypothetical protein
MVDLSSFKKLSFKTPPEKPVFWAGFQVIRELPAPGT